MKQQFEITESLLETAANSRSASESDQTVATLNIRLEPLVPPAVSIVIPAKNEVRSLEQLLPRLKKGFPDAEVIIVNDGSTDDTAHVVKNHDVKLVSHPYSMGNGAAIKSGARAATGDVLVFMDADGQHDTADIEAVLTKLARGYDMVVGARTASSQASRYRRFANALYNKLASIVTGHKIPDLTSGFRAIKAGRMREFLYLLPNGFSYPTTITMAFFRNGYPVGYTPIHAKTRIGKSHIRLLRDGMRFLIIIFKIGTLYSPLKIFVPTSLLFFMSGISYYIYTFMTQGRLTNMVALLFFTGILTFLIGLVSEQITQLLYTTRRAPFRADDDRGSSRQPQNSGYSDAARSKG